MYDLEKEYKKAMLQLELAHIPVEASRIVGVSVNKRLHRRLGQTRSMGRDTYVIEIGSTTMTLPYEEFRITLIHEILHTLPNCFNHGSVWKKWAKVAAEEFGIDIERYHKFQSEEGEEAYRKTAFKYHIYCKDCGEVLAYKARNCAIVRDVQKPEMAWMFSCPKCRSHALGVKVY